MIDDDPYLWLEEVEGERALAWVRARNAATEAELESRPGCGALRESLREVLDARDQIPYATRRGDHLYNLWRDADHARGLWRRTTLDEYRRREPRWQTLIDLDALGAAEGQAWVWAGATALGPAYRRALVSLSRGGSDAVVVREFDLDRRAFVAGGFELPEAKSRVAWSGADEVYVGTDFGPGSLTDSGYPRLIKRWRRGQPLSEAQTVYEGAAADVSAFVSVDATPGWERTIVGSAVDFYSDRRFLLDGGHRIAIDKPADAQLEFRRDRVFIELRSDWALADGHGWPRGSLLVADAAAYLRGGRAFTPLFTPTPTRSLAGHACGRDAVWLTVLDDVASRIEEWTEVDGRWQRREVAAPYPGRLEVTALHDPLVASDALAECYWLNGADFLRPDQLELGRAGSDARERLKSRPAFFDAAGMRVEQRFATSRDGTRVPYFIVWPRDARADGAEGDHPTLLYGYGGFEVSLTPSYSGTLGRAWTGRGGVYVLANIRGGGEFGPAWHQAAVREHKQRSYDDFAAVAADLVAGGVTRPQRLGIMGGSNGGLLVGATMVQRPELFGAVVCQVPLLDMQRYSRLLAGASWMAEYGDPERAGDWAWISTYSPYQNVKPGVRM
ncbi:MAG: S9 family peptidase, partial [Burkholderiales bacterium]|nr:S9 family peptidase [Burkholderiales bacterium]